MRHGALLAGALVSLVVCSRIAVLAQGHVENPYQAILERNVFGLRTPPPPSAATPAKPPPPKIFLTGITTILGEKLVLLKTTTPAKPGKPAKELSLMLSEGQRQNDVQVLKIDAKGRKVKVNNGGTEMVLTFKDNGVPAPAVAGKPTGWHPSLPNLRFAGARAGYRPGVGGGAVNFRGSFPSPISARFPRR